MKEMNNKKKKGSSNFMLQKPSLYKYQLTQRLNK